MHMKQNGSNYDQAFKSYRAGTKSNWSDPNSTDIHSVSKIKNVAAYLVKYMSKGNRSNAVEVANEDKLEATEGKIWATSRNLGRIKSQSFEMGVEIYEELKRLEATKGRKVIQEEHFKLIIVDVEEIMNECTVLGQRVKEWINTITQTIAVPAQVIEFHAQYHKLKKA